MSKSRMIAALAAMTTLLLTGFCLVGPAEAFKLRVPKNALSGILHRTVTDTRQKLDSTTEHRTARNDSLLRGTAADPSHRSSAAQDGAERPAPIELGGIGPNTKPLPPEGVEGSPANGAKTDSAKTDSTDAVLEDILLSPEPYYYQSVGRRDPFSSMIDDDYVVEHGDDLMTPGDLVITGILWGEKDRFALVETSTGRSVILRDGDQYGPFTVARVEPDGVVLNRMEFGVSQTFRLSLAEGKGTRNARGER